MFNYYLTNGMCIGSKDKYNIGCGLAACGLVDQKSIRNNKFFLIEFVYALKKRKPRNQE